MSRENNSVRIATTSLKPTEMCTSLDH